uniref:Uncharacterized protein n=1 Tax=Candidatus Kentrum sp. FW TaxID=2126338 RepID=A0A450RXW2_9GAMM|nr:MAG: hypothetical protein BECKFW1821A_GA0114235_100544 [Candidatus Kentron sp. FW]
MYQALVLFIVSIGCTGLFAHLLFISPLSDEISFLRSDNCKLRSDLRNMSQERQFPNDENIVPCLSPTQGPTAGLGSIVVNKFYYLR